jgi:pyruvate dehydrogenase E1 component beta subunit
MSGGKARAPIVFRGPNGAAAGVAAQHSQCLSPWYASVPGRVVLSPWNSTDARGLLKAAGRHNGPVVFLENELLYGVSFPTEEQVLDKDFTLPIGKAKVEKTGSDITLIAHSRSVGLCLEAAQELAESNSINAEVINLRSLRPLDFSTISNSIQKTNRAVIVDGGWPFCGIASEISAQITERIFALNRRDIRLSSHSGVAGDRCGPSNALFSAPRRGFAAKCFRCCKCCKVSISQK